MDRNPLSRRPGIILALMWRDIPVAVLKHGLVDSVQRSATLTKAVGAHLIVFLLFAVLFYVVYLLCNMPIFVAMTCLSEAWCKPTTAMVAGCPTVGLRLSVLG